MESGTSFESALSAAQGDAEVALKSAGSLTRELRKAKAAAVSGQVREIRRERYAAPSHVLDRRPFADRDGSASSVR